MNYVEFKFFHFSIAYTEGNSRNFIQVLHVYVRLQYIADILKTYEFKVVIVWGHSAVMDHL